MKKFALFAALVIAAFAASFWDRSRATETTLRAAITNVEARDAENGPDQWFMVVDVEGTPQTLGPLQARPTEAAGDTVCVIQSTANHRDTTYRRAPASTVC